MDESPIPGISYYRVVATVNGVVSECSESVEAGLFFPVDVTTCSTEAIDLSVAIWKENQRFYLTPDQFLNADMREVRVEGLAVKTRAGEFIISPTLLNSNDVSATNAMRYYSELLPSQEQALVISARRQEINSTLEKIGWTPFETETENYFYLTKTPIEQGQNYALELKNHTGGELTQSAYGHIRGIREIPAVGPIDWHNEGDMTLAEMEDGTEGLKISIADREFIIKLHDEQAGELNKEAAVTLYGDILPSKQEAEIIAMRYADINRKLQEFGGEPFKAGNYFTSVQIDPEQSYVISFSDSADASIELASKGYVRGVKSLNMPEEQVFTFAAYDITHSVNAEEDDPIGKIQWINSNGNEVVYLERDGIFLTRNSNGTWNQTWTCPESFGFAIDGHVRAYENQRYQCAQTGVTYTADAYGRLHANGEAINEPIKVTTWNVGGFNKGNSGKFFTTDSVRYREIITEFKAVIDSIKPDLIGCEEFLAQIYPDSLIRNDLFGDYPYASIPAIDLDYQAKGVFSRFPLYNSHAFKVGQSYALETDVLIGNTTYKLCLLHPTWWKSEIDNNWLELEELAHRYKYVDCVIMMGDFNILKEREAESWGLFTSSGFNLANFSSLGTLPTTYNSVICSMTLDNILVKGGEILEISTVQFTPEGVDPTMPNAADELLWDEVNPSDHFPFSAIINLR